MNELSMPEIKRVEALARTKEGCISFAQGAVRIGGVDAHIKEYARQIILTDKADYYQDALGILALRKKIVEQLSHEHDVSLGLEHVLVSHGAVGAFTSLCLTVLQVDDEVIIPEPAYPVYKNVILFSKAKPVFVPAFKMQLDGGKKNSWKFDVEAIKKAITPKTKMMVFSNPSNPCGNFLSKEELVELKRLCEARGIFLVMDEIYEDFVFEGEFYSATPLVTESDFVVRLGSFSKNFGMSGWRVGYLIAQPYLINAIAPIQACSLGCPTVISQYAALYGLEHKKEILETQYEKIKKGRDLACLFFDRMQEQGIFSYAKPASGIYIFFKTQHEDSVDFVMDVLNTANIAMAPGFDFGPSCKGYVRFCFAREPEVVAEGIKRFQDFFLLRHRVASAQMMGINL